MLVGYRRASTIEQKAGYEEQERLLKEVGCEKIFGEQVSAVAHRDELLKALEWVREGDVLVVTALSRLARSIPDLVKITETLERKKVTLRILDMSLDTSTSTGRLMLNLIGSVAQFEREVMLERQRVGIAAAREQKRYKGRKPIIPIYLERIVSLDSEGFTPTQIGRKLGISRRTVYRALATVPEDRAVG